MSGVPLYTRSNPHSSHCSSFLSDVQESRSHSNGYDLYDDSLNRQFPIQDRLDGPFPEVAGGCEGDHS
jgi:hypothetical protein